MRLIPQSPKKTLKAFLKQKPFRSEIDIFKQNLILLLDKINVIEKRPKDESEEHLKNDLRDFLRDTFYKNNNAINTKDKKDLVIHLEKSTNSEVGVIIEAKRPTNVGEMVSDYNPNKKALHELILYYLNERFQENNNQLKQLIVTNIYEWYIIDANQFDKYIYRNSKIRKLYETKITDKKDNPWFYDEISKIISSIEIELPYVFFDLRNYDAILRNENKIDDKELIALYKIFSPQYLLKAVTFNDSNSLNSGFYKELLHIIGLEEAKSNGKNIIRRKVENKNDASLLETTIEALITNDPFHKVPDISFYGNTKDERVFSIALELCITWVNRILFLKLLEGQLISYHQGDKSYRFLNCETIQDFDELFKLFHRVLAVNLGSFALLGAGFIGAEFVASGDNGEFQVQIELPKDAPIEQTNFLTQKIEEKLLSDPNITTVFTTVGKSSGQNAAGASPYLAEINVKLVPAEERSLNSTDYAAMVKLDIQSTVPGAKITAAPLSMVGGATAAPIQFIVRGANLDSILSFSERAIEGIKGIAGTREVKASVEGGNPEIAVIINREKMAELGLSLDVVGATMQNAYTGNDQSKLMQGDDEYPIRIQLDQFDRKNLNDIRNLSFQNTGGQLIRLSQFASTDLSSGPSKLERKDKISTVTLQAQVVGRPVGTVGQEVQALLDKMPKPAGVDIEAAGDVKNQQEAFGSLALALLASILLVYLIMVALYDNYIYPLVVMLSVPVAMVGAFLALALTMTNLSIFGMLGLIMLVGLVIKNAILIVDFTNHLKTQGVSSRAAIMEGTMARFRPILMTTIAMVIAMIPIAIASGAGSEWKNGLAWVLIGGLTSSMLLTLIIVPVAYLSVDLIKEKRALNKANKAAKQLSINNFFTNNLDNTKWTN